MMARSRSICCGNYLGLDVVIGFLGRNLRLRGLGGGLLGDLFTFLLDNSRHAGRAVKWKKAAIVFVAKALDRIGHRAGHATGRSVVKGRYKEASLGRSRDFRCKKGHTRDVAVRSDGWGHEMVFVDLADTERWRRVLDDRHFAVDGLQDLLGHASGLDCRLGLAHDCLAFGDFLGSRCFLPCDLGRRSDRYSGSGE